MPPKQRVAFIGIEKIALRCRKKENPLATQKELAVWFKNEFKKPTVPVSHRIPSGMLQHLRLLEEQLGNGNKQLIDQLYRHERVVRARRLKGLHQSTLTSFYKS